MSEDALKNRIEELESRLDELTEQVRRVSDERDAALRELALLRGEEMGPPPRPTIDVPASESGLGVCTFCDGEGVYWVHDFEMKCKRCDGTGIAARDSAGASTDRH
jgi:hypothetical protein